MKFSVAAIVLSQSLPTWSKVTGRAKLSQSGVRPRTVESANIFRAAQEKRLTAAQRRLAFHLKGLSNGPRILKANVYCDPTSTDPDIGILSCGESRMCQASLGSEFGGICIPKPNTKKQSSKGNGVKTLIPKRSRHGRLGNREAAANPVPCDPTSVDIGILACGQDKFCKVDKNSELGGFCSSAPITSRRLDTVAVCDETSPYFISGCDCTGLDNTTGTGVVPCLLYDDYPLPGISSACEGITLAFSVNYTYEASVVTGYTGCYAMKTPYYQKLCYTYVVSDASCSLTFNGQPCNSCSVIANSTYYDCSNVQGSGAGESPLDLMPAVAACLYPFSGNGTTSYNCTQLCSEGDYIAYALYGVNVTLPGYGEFACGYLAIAQNLALIPDEACPVLSTAAQTSCCAEQCKLCGVTGYIPIDNYDTQLNLTVPGYEGLTCGSFAYAAYVNFSLPEGSCTTIGGLIQQTCCQAIPAECSLCDGPLTYPNAIATIEDYTVACALLESFLTAQECVLVSSQASPVCCSASASSAPVETPTGAPTTTTPTTLPEPEESGGDAPNGSEEAGSPDTARSILTRGGLLSSIGGAMIAAFLLVASS